MLVVLRIKKSTFFPPLPRLTHSDTQMKRLEPWKIALIVLSILAFLALVIGLLVFFLSNGRCNSLVIPTQKCCKCCWGFTTAFFMLCSKNKIQSSVENTH